MAGSRASGGVAASGQPPGSRGMSAGPGAR